MTEAVEHRAACMLLATCGYFGEFFETQRLGSRCQNAAKQFRPRILLDIPSSLLMALICATATELPTFNAVVVFNLEGSQLLRGVAIVHIHNDHRAQGCPQIFVDVGPHELHGP